MFTHEYTERVTQINKDRIALNLLKLQMGDLNQLHSNSFIFSAEVTLIVCKKSVFHGPAVRQLSAKQQVIVMLELLAQHVCRAYVNQISLYLSSLLRFLLI